MLLEEFHKNKASFGFGRGNFAAVLRYDRIGQEALGFHLEIVNNKCYIADLSHIMHSIFHSRTSKNLGVRGLNNSHLVPLALLQIQRLLCTRN